MSKVAGPGSVQMVECIIYFVTQQDLDNHAAILSKLPSEQAARIIKSVQDHKPRGLHLLKVRHNVV